MILSWIFFTLPPLLTWGYVKNPIKPETTYSTINAAEFTGPTDLCLVLGLAIGDYSISSPSSGEYTWLLQEPDGNTTTVAKGGAGSITATANLIVPECQHVFQSWKNGRSEAADQAQKHLTALRIAFESYSFVSELKYTMETSNNCLQNNFFRIYIFLG